MRPLVSVIIPVYNTAKYLERCIESVLSSSYGNLEILAIDDGSTDGSGEILDRLAETDKRLIVVHQENQGVAASRNKGLDLASGTFLTFVDSDDYIGENYIRRFVSCMKKNAADRMYRMPFALGGMRANSPVAGVFPVICAPPFLKVLLF